MDWVGRDHVELPIGHGEEITTVVDRRLTFLLRKTPPVISSR